MTLILTPKDNGKVIDLGGQVSLNFATLADGSCVIAHGLSGTPSFINYTIKSSTPIHLQAPTFDSTNITFKGFTAGGVAITTGTYVIVLEAKL